MEDEDRIIGADSQVGDGRDRALRPLTFDDFVGQKAAIKNLKVYVEACLLYTSPSPRDATLSRMPSSA